MPLDQTRLDRSVNQSRGIFDKYIYRPDNSDTIADIQAPGYFARSRFVKDWSDGIIEVMAADGFATMQITQDGQSAFAVSGSASPVEIVSITPAITGFYSSASQQPTGLGDAGKIKVSFGPGGTTSGGEFTVASDGTITTNAEATAPQYEFLFLMRFARTTSPGEAKLLARFMYAVNGVEENGIQVGETWGALVDDGDTVWRETFNAPFSPAVGSIVWAEVARDPSGIDNGGLDSFQPSGDLAGWRDVVTARVQIRKYQGA